jgi:hypothetical protein
VLVVVVVLLAELLHLMEQLQPLVAVLEVQALKVQMDQAPQ